MHAHFIALVTGSMQSRKCQRACFMIVMNVPWSMFTDAELDPAISRGLCWSELVLLPFFTFLFVLSTPLSYSLCLLMRKYACLINVLCFPLSAIPTVTLLSFLMFGHITQFFIALLFSCRFDFFWYCKFILIYLWVLWVESYSMLVVLAF